MSQPIDKNNTSQLPLLLGTALGAGALAAPRNGAADDLSLIWGVADKIAARMNALGIWHFDQIADYKSVADSVAA